MVVAMRAATSTPRSARMRVSSISTIRSGESGPRMTRSEIAWPMAPDVRLRPPVRRPHQEPFFSVLSFMSGAVIAVSSMNAKLTPEEMVARLLYRDGLMLVIDKPAGIAVHRGPKGGESLEDHFGALRFGLPRAPALAHRLDRETSGCLVLGRHRKALAQLGKLFKSGAIGKTYWAIVDGSPEAEEGQIELPLGRLDVARGWWMKHDPAGQPAVTKWKVMGRSSLTSPWKGEVDLPQAGLVGVMDRKASPRPATPSLASRAKAGDPPPAGEGKAFCWLALEPLTGRTHQ